jgi:hypothetical protein
MAEDLFWSVVVLSIFYAPLVAYSIYLGGKNKW